MDRMTKEELRSKPDDFLLDLVKKAVTEHHTGKDFAETYSADFSYNFLRNELEARGWVDDWHKVTPTDAPTTTIEMHTIDKTTRRTYSISKETAERWSAFIADKPYTAILTDEALKRFMDDYENHVVELICRF